MSPTWKKRIKRTLLVLAIALPVSVLGLWIAIHTFPALGPWLADGLRAIVGPAAVARLEELGYSSEDRFNTWWRADEPPKTYWEVPEVEPQQAASAAPGAPPPFRPADVGPASKAQSAKGDGRWVAVTDSLSEGAPVMWKTLLHPDAKRPWAELFVVALDPRQIDIHLVAGTQEPKPLTAEGRAYERQGLIRAEHHGALIAAFNGGFKAEHGHWGLRVDGVTLLPLRKLGCTVAKLADGSISIANYDGEENAYPDAAWWRQTPPCMFRNGKRHGGLWDPESLNWGAAIGGDSIIRRSAIGLDASKSILFVGMSNHTSAQAIADGMSHAGAVDVAQLDINWSFPRFILYKREGGTITAESLFPGFDIAPDEYVRAPSTRDYFYVTRKASST
jgi:hypothetical protein